MRLAKRARLWAAITTLCLITGLFAPAAASAGTLTSASFTTIGTGYAATSAQNTRYDWNYTTATSSTLTRVSQTVPAGTSTYNPRYFASYPSTGNYISTPSSAANSARTDLDIRVKVADAGLGKGNWEILVNKEQLIGEQQSRLSIWY